MTAPRKIVNRTKTLLTARWQEILILGWVPLLAGLLKSPPGDWYQTGPWYQNKEDRTGKKSRTAASTGPPDVVMLGSCADGQNDPSSPGQGEGGRGVPGAHRERRNPFICIFPNFIREHLPSRDGSNVLPSARPLIPCINHFFRLLCVPGPKKKKKKKPQPTVLPLPLVVSDACFHFQI